jgi:site-specific DNA-cytosine methylase
MPDKGRMQMVVQSAVPRGAVGINGDVAGTLDANYGKGPGSANYGERDVVVQHRMAVRRLTPVECERLQGFPDGWTQIPWKKKPVSECPDGPRYKALGNSMACNVMRWIGRRIELVDEVFAELEAGSKETS